MLVGGRGLRQLLLAAVATAACVALAGLVLHSGSGPSELMGYPVKGRSPASKSTLIHKLNQLLMKKLSAATVKAQTGVSPRAADGAASSGGSGMSTKQMQANACHDGGPCGGNDMPVLKYVPSTGAWHLQSAGNPEVVWRSLFAKAKARDEKNRVPHRTVAETDFKAPTQMLAQVAEATGERAALQAKLKSLLQSQLRSTGDLGGAGGFGADADRGRDDVGLEGGEESNIKDLAQSLTEARHLIAHGGAGDVKRMTAVSASLQDASQLRAICSETSAAQQDLGVLRWSSLSSCMRQLRTRMADDSKRLAGRVTALSTHAAFPVAHAEVAAAPFSLKAAESRYDTLEARKAALTQGLSKMVNAGTHLQVQLRAQKERLQQLRARPSRSAMGRHAHRGSPPAPAGLPPGYDGPRLEKGSTDVPRSPPPGM
ncbi:hypothetical protein T484DRAFT_1947838 [Baffinella frigidus]|nr:hypothetical protein T484DRAFT_1947838 [Cryptophyta sp. CCMP2293]